LCSARMDVDDEKAVVLQQRAFEAWKLAQSDAHSADTSAPHPLEVEEAVATLAPADAWTANKRERADIVRGDGCWSGWTAASDDSLGRRP
jgi:hypothetical protein